MTRTLEAIIATSEFPKVLQALFSTGNVKSLVAAQTKKDRLTLAPVIVTDPNNLNDFPLTNFIAFGFDTPDTSAGVIHRKLNGARDQAVAFVGRPEDRNALVELAKRKQVNLANIVSVIIEGVGTVNQKKLARQLKKLKMEPGNISGEFITTDGLLLFDAARKKSNVPFDKVLQRDDSFSSHGEVPSDIYISLVGLPEDGSTLYIAAGTPLGEQVIKGSGVKLKPLPSGYADLKDKLLKAAWDAMDVQVGILGAAQSQIPAADYLEGLTKCIACGLCITVCPVCYCKDCNLKAQRKEKTIDPVSYQLTRLAHIGDSCIGCGRCNAICPTGVPLTKYLMKIRRGVKDALGYEAGLNLEVPPPRSKRSVCPA